MTILVEISILDEAGKKIDVTSVAVCGETSIAGLIEAGHMALDVLSEKDPKRLPFFQLSLLRDGAVANS